MLIEDINDQMDDIGLMAQMSRSNFMLCDGKSCRRTWDHPYRLGKWTDGRGRWKTYHWDDTKKLNARYKWMEHEIEEVEEVEKEKTMSMMQKKAEENDICNKRQFQGTCRSCEKYWHKVADCKQRCK